MFVCSWDVGPTHIISIDSEFYYYLWYGVDLIAEQYHWLEEDLRQANQAAQRAKHPWIVTMFHHPMYCTTVNLQDCNNHESLVRNVLKGDCGQQIFVTINR